MILPGWKKQPGCVCCEWCPKSSLLAEMQYHTNTAKNKLCCFSFPHLSGSDKYTALTAPRINPTTLYKAKHQKATMLSTALLQENNSPFLPVPICGQRLMILKFFLFYLALLLQRPYENRILDMKS